MRAGQLDAARAACVRSAAAAEAASRAGCGARSYRKRAFDGSPFTCYCPVYSIACEPWARGGCGFSLIPVGSRRPPAASQSSTSQRWAAGPAADARTQSPAAPRCVRPPCPARSRRAIYRGLPALQVPFGRVVHPACRLRAQRGVIGCDGSPTGMGTPNTAPTACHTTPKTKTKTKTKTGPPPEQKPRQTAHHPYRLRSWPKTHGSSNGKTAAALNPPRLPSHCIPCTFPFQSLHPNLPASAIDGGHFVPAGAFTSLVTIPHKQLAPAEFMHVLEWRGGQRKGRQQQQQQQQQEAQPVEGGRQEQEGVAGNSSGGLQNTPPPCS